MTRITVAEHLKHMQENSSPPWLIELGEMLQELEGIDSALAASLAYDLSRDQHTAQGVHQLVQGYQTLKDVLSANHLTSIQTGTIKKVLEKISRELFALSSSKPHFQPHEFYEAEKER